MATASGRKAGNLKELVLRGHDSVNVYQLMRLIMAGSTLPLDQRLRFRADLSAAFPAREFATVKARRRDGDGAEVIDISTANYCIASVLGPLPEPYTEWLRDLVRDREPAMAEFLDIFNHRLNVLRFQLKSAQAIGLNSLPPAQTPLAHALAALMGMSAPELAAQLPLPPRAWIGLAGLLANNRRSASTITQVLSLYLNAKVSLVPMVGAWHDIEAQDRIALGQRRHRLGQDAVLGRRVWDQQARVRLLVATIDYERLCQLLPPNLAELRQEAGAGLPPPLGAGGASYDGFVALLRLLVDRLVDCEIELSVDEAHIGPPLLPAAQAPHAGGSRTGLRLGHSAWLGAGRAQRTRPVRYLVPAFGPARAAA